MNSQTPGGSHTSSAATNHPPKCHQDASVVSPSLIYTSSPYPMSNATHVHFGQNHNSPNAFLADVIHSENPVENIADATAKFSCLSLMPPKNVATRRKRAIGSPWHDVKAARPESRKPNDAPMSYELPPIGPSLRLSLAQQYDDIQLPFRKRRRCSLSDPQDPSASHWPSSKRVLLETIAEEEKVVFPSQP